MHSASSKTTTLKKESELIRQIMEIKWNTKKQKKTKNSIQRTTGNEGKKGTKNKWNK